MSAATNTRGWKICKVLHTDTLDCPNQAKTFSNVHLHAVVCFHHHLHTIVLLQEMLSHSVPLAVYYTARFAILHYSALFATVILFH